MAHSATHLTEPGRLPKSELVAKAQLYAVQILTFRSDAAAFDSGFASASVGGLEPVHSRRVGVELLALHALKQLQLDERMRALGY